MKLVLYLTLLSLILLIACKRDPVSPPLPITPYWGEVSVKKDGATWTASPVAFLNNRYGIDLTFDSLDQFGILREQCQIFKIPYEAGTYPILSSDYHKNDSLAGAFLFFADGDVLLGGYSVLAADSSSFITLLSYDTTTKEVKGTFDITFIAGYKPYPGAPDTIRFDNGIFHTKVAN